MTMDWYDDPQAALQDVTNRMFDLQRHIEQIPHMSNVHDMSKKSENIQRKLRNLESLLDDGYFFAGERDSDVDAKQITQQLDKNKTFVADLKQRLRQAKLQCRINIQKQSEATREELLRVNTSVRRANRMVHDKFTGEVAKERSRQSTAALKRIGEIMASEIARTNTVLDTLDDTNKKLEDTYGEHKGYASALREGKSIITRLRRRDLTDKWLVWLGFAFFCLCVLYIVKKRLSPSATFIWSLFRPLISSSSPLSSPSPTDEVAVSSDTTSSNIPLHDELG